MEHHSIIILFHPNSITVRGLEQENVVPTTQFVATFIKRVDVVHRMPEDRSMSVFGAILKRRTCRKFASQPVELEKIFEIITAGTHAPSSGNLQNWSFVIVTEKPKIRALYHHTLEQEAFMSAPVAVIVCGDNDIAEKYYGLRGKRLYTIQNCAACIENMLLAAETLGIGACWIGAFDEEKIDAMFTIPATVRAQAILLLGYSEDEPEPKEQKRIENLVYFNTYGQTLKKPYLVYRDYSKEWELQLAQLKQKWADVKRETNLPSPTIAKEKTEEFFKETSKKVGRFVENLKDEEKVRRRR